MRVQWDVLNDGAVPICDNMVSMTVWDPSKETWVSYTKSLVIPELKWMASSAVRDWITECARGLPDGVLRACVMRDEANQEYSEHVHIGLVFYAGARELIDNNKPVFTGNSSTGPVRPLIDKPEHPLLAFSEVTPKPYQVKDLWERLMDGDDSV